MPEKKQGVVPRLRFPEFRNAGPWEVKRLGDKRIAKFVRERVSPERIPLGHYVSTVNLLPDFAGLSPAPEPPPPNSAVAYRKGDILMSNIRPYLKKIWIADRSGGASNDVLVVRPGENTVGGFLGQILMSDRFVAHVMDGAKGVKMPRGDLKQIQDFEVPLPQKAEQQKIADCLSSLDELIELQAKRLDALKAHKKGLLQQLFPCEGQTTPRLRFPEFRNAGPWEVKRLGEIAQCYQPATVSVSTTVQDGPFPVYGANGVIGFLDRYNHEDPQVIVGCRGQCGTVFLTPPKSWITGNAMVIAVHDHTKVDKVFLYYVMIASDVAYLVTGSAQPQITGDIKRHRVALPSPSEQQKIADCLSSLDELIELQAKRLDALKAHKKGLLQQLFPQEIE